ncbi:ECM3_1 [Sanghuangporus sanghuang]
MLSVGALIWVSVRPLIRLVLCTLCGFIITKADIFPPVAARGMGQVLLNITLPALMFSKIVPAFTSDNVGALGPLILVAFLYEAFGIIIAWLVKQFFWVPHRFRYGILVAGGWSNVGDVPTAVIMSITGSAPFNGSTDQTVAVAYLAAFIIVFFITLFPLGGVKLIERDYVGPDMDDEEVRKSVPEKTTESIRRISKNLSSVRRRVAGRRKTKKSDGMDKDLEKSEDPERVEDGKCKNEGDVHEKAIEEDAFVSEFDCIEERRSTLAAPEPQFAQPSRFQRQKHVSFQHDVELDDNAAVVPERVYLPTRSASASATAAGNDCHPSRVTSPAPSLTPGDSECTHPSHRPLFSRRTSQNPSTTTATIANDAALPSPAHDHKLPSSVGPPTTPRPRPRAARHVLLAHTRTILLSMLTPQAIAIFVALLIALVPILKSLFTPVDSDGDGSNLVPNAPDGQPPLAFVLDTASFIGAASVPLGLICLGSALARLQVPHSPAQWRSLPLGAISALAIGKMVVMPIVGVLLTQGLTAAGIIDESDKVLRFVCIFLSCIPTATTQVFLTQVYSGTGEATTLSAFLVPQYALMFITMTILTAFTLTLLF